MGTIQFNGVAHTVDAINYTKNGVTTALDELQLNGVTVWTRLQPVTYTMTANSVSGQSKQTTFNINRYCYSGSGKTRTGAYNTANKYDAVITYSDNTTYTIPRDNFWTTVVNRENYFEFTNPYPNKVVKSLFINFYIYATVVITSELTYLGNDV